MRRGQPLNCRQNGWSQIATVNITATYLAWYDSVCRLQWFQRCWHRTWPYIHHTCQEHRLHRGRAGTVLWSTGHPDRNTQAHLEGTLRTEVFLIVARLAIIFTVWFTWWHYARLSTTMISDIRTLCFVLMQNRNIHPWNQDTSLIRPLFLGPKSVCIWRVHCTVNERERELMYIRSLNLIIELCTRQATKSSCRDLRG